MQYARPERYKSRLVFFRKPNLNVTFLDWEEAVVKEKKYERTDENQMADRR